MHLVTQDPFPTAEWQNSCYGFSNLPRMSPAGDLKPARPASNRSTNSFLVILKSIQDLVLVFSLSFFNAFSFLSYLICRSGIPAATHNVCLYDFCTESVPTFDFFVTPCSTQPCHCEAPKEPRQSRDKMEITTAASAASR